MKTFVKADATDKANRRVLRDLTNISVRDRNRKIKFEKTPTPTKPTKEAEKLAEPKEANSECSPEFDIMDYWLNIEQQIPLWPDYMKWQPLRPSMRELLVDWIVQVHMKYRLEIEIVYRAVSLIDRFLERQSVPHTKLQLVGCAALIIACKTESQYSLPVDSIVRIASGAFTRDELIHAENVMLTQLNFQVRIPTTLQFGDHLSQNLSPGAHFYARYLMELTLQEYEFLRYRPSQIAAAAVLLGIKRQQKSPANGVVYCCEGFDENLCRYSVDGLQERLEELAARAPTKCCAVRKKYAKDLESEC